MAETRTMQLLTALRQHLSEGCGLLGWGADNAAVICDVAIEEQAEQAAALAAAVEARQAAERVAYGLTVLRDAVKANSPKRYLMGHGCHYDAPGDWGPVLKALHDLDCQGKTAGAPGEGPAGETE